MPVIYECDKCEDRESAHFDQARRRFIPPRGWSEQFVEYGMKSNYPYPERIACVILCSTCKEG